MYIYLELLQHNNRTAISVLCNIPNGDNKAGNTVSGALRPWHAIKGKEKESMRIQVFYPT